MEILKPICLLHRSTPTTQLNIYAHTDTIRTNSHMFECFAYSVTRYTCHLTRSAVGRAEFHSQAPASRQACWHRSSHPPSQERRAAPRAYSKQTAKQARNQPIHAPHSQNDFLDCCCIVRPSLERGVKRFKFYVLCFEFYSVVSPRAPAPRLARSPSQQQHDLEAKKVPPWNGAARPPLSLSLHHPNARTAGAEN